MKRLSLHHCIAVLLLAILGFIVIHAPITVYISSHWPQVADVAKAWKELLMLAAGLLLVIACTRQHAWRIVLRDRLLILMAGFIALHLAVALVIHLPLQAVIAGLMIDLRFIAYFILVYVFVRLYPQYRPSFIRIGVCGAVIVAGFAVLQLALPHNFLAYFGYGDNTIQPYMTIDDNPDFVRHNSTLRGPNPLGAYAIMVLAAVAAFVVYKWHKVKGAWLRTGVVAMGIAGFVALWISYSRSALIGAVLAVALVVAVRYRKWFTPARLAMVVAVVLVVGLGSFAARDTYFVQNVLLHNNETTGAHIDSNEGHMSSLKNGIERSVSEPLGNGVGSTGSASLYTNNPLIIENQFLFIAHEVGWPGLALFGAIMVAVFVRLWRLRKQWLALGLFASGIGLSAVGMLLPVWVDDTVSIVWWGLTAAVVAMPWEGAYGRTTDKKAKRTA